MQLTALGTIVPIQFPIDAKPGMPTRGTVLLTPEPSASSHPATGLGLGGWLMPQASEQDAYAALELLRRDSAQPLGILKYHPHGMKGDLAYGIAPLVQLTWQDGGYGGSFRERRVHEFGSSINAVPGHRGAFLIVVADRTHKLTDVIPAFGGI